MKTKRFKGGAKTEALGLGIGQIPLISLMEIGKRFKMGEKRYGLDNWKKGDKEWLKERYEHAIKHLYQYWEGKGEDSPIGNLAAVAWFGIIAMWHEQHKHEKTN